MLDTMEVVMVVLLGLALGSFVNALVWRLRIREQILPSSIQKKKSDTRNQKSEYSIFKGRSMCPNCKHTLGWKDLIPVISWLSLKGKCRYCKKPISIQYPLVELFVTLLLVISYLFWLNPLNNVTSYAILVNWLAILIILVALALYDLKWLILPTELIYIIFGLGALSVVLSCFQEGDAALAVSRIVGSFFLGGLFWLLYQFSGGKWIGGGDVRLGFAMGLYLGWQQALLGLSLAAYIGTLIVIVMVVLGKYHKKMKLPFGPLLITGWFICALWGQAIINWYLRLSGI